MVSIRVKAFLLLLSLAFTFAFAAEWPPEGTTQIRAYTFSGRPKNLIFENDKFDPSVQPKEGFLLSKKQVREVTHILLNSSHDYGQYACFEPRNALVCYDSNGKPLASLNICFTCVKSKASPAKFSKSFDYALMAQFFASLKLPGAYKFEDENTTVYTKFYWKKVRYWRARVAQAANRPIEAEWWKTAKPSDAEILKIGDHVYLSSWRLYDSFDGIKILDEKGEVTPNLCKLPVRVMGLT